MPRTVGKPILVLKDIWQAYALKLLKENPTWWSRYSKKLKCSHYSIGYTTPQGIQVEVINYSRFRKTIEYYFDRAKRAIIQGECVNMTSKVGKIYVKRVERDFRKDRQRKIDWGKTRQQPMVWSEEKQRMVYSKVIYFSTDEWCRIAWIKNGAIPNETVYKFSPSSRNSAGTTGFKLEFSEAQRTDPLLKYRYLYVPLIINQTL